MNGIISVVLARVSSQGQIDPFYITFQMIMNYITMLLLKQIDTAQKNEVFIYLKYWCCYRVFISISIFKSF